MSEYPIALTQARGGATLAVTTSPVKLSWPGSAMAGVKLHNSADSLGEVVVAVVDEHSSDAPPLTTSEMSGLISTGDDLGWIWGQLLPGNGGWIPFGGRSGSGISIYLWTLDGTAQVGAIYCR